MSHLARLLMMIPHITSVAPSTVSYAADVFWTGFTGPISFSKDSSRVYFQVQLTLWSGYISGTEAKWTMTSDYGDYDGAVQVAIDGGVFTNAPRSGQEYTLFTGLTDGPHFVEIRIAPGLGEAAYMASTGTVLTVTGAPPLLITHPERVVVGTSSSTGIYSGSVLALSNGYNPPLQAPSNTVYGSNIGSVKMKGAFTKLIVTLNGSRKVGVSKNGGPPSFYSIADESGEPSRALVIPCDGSTSTYNVWDSGNFRTAGGVFAVAGDSTRLDIGTARRLDQYGDSITYGAGPGATSVDVETMSVAAKMGFVGSTNGISGQTIAGCKAMLDAVLAGRTVGSTDVAILAIGGNSVGGDGINATEQDDYNACIDKLLTKGYTKVFCRGILPLADSASNDLVIAANVTLKAVMDARADSRLVWVDTSTWTGYATQDGVHPTAAGYVTLAGYAYTAYTALLGL